MGLRKKKKTVDGVVLADMMISCDTVAAISEHS